MLIMSVLSAGFVTLVLWSATSDRGAARMLAGLLAVAALLLMGIGVLLVTGVR